MFKRRERQAEDERLDRVGRALLRAAGDEETAERAASAPFLYARVRARINAEQTRQNGVGEEGWLALLSISRRAVPALSGVAALALALTLWLASGGTATSTPIPMPLSDDALAEARDAGVEQAVLIGSQNLSRDDVLDIVVARDAQETQSR
jgi:hypothetical protein